MASSKEQNLSRCLFGEVVYYLLFYPPSCVEVYVVEVQAQLFPFHYIIHNAAGREPQTLVGGMDAYVGKGEVVQPSAGDYAQMKRRCEVAQHRH